MAIRLGNTAKAEQTPLESRRTENGSGGKNEWVSMFALSIKYTKTKSEIYINISTLFSPCALAHCFLVAVPPPCSSVVFHTPPHLARRIPARLATFCGKRLAVPFPSEARGKGIFCKHRHLCHWPEGMELGGQTHAATAVELSS